MEFQKLLIKFFAKEISDDELELLKQWLLKDKKNKQIFDIENELWHKLSFRVHYEEFKSDEAWNLISSKLGISEKNKKVILLRKINYLMLISVACITILLTLGIISYFISVKSDYKRNTFSPAIISTGEGEKSKILLPDSTQIILNAGSKLEYNGQYNFRKRNVSLNGEAYFDVHTNPKKPFVVQLDYMTISATGTKFNVLSYENENRIEATLIEGKIQVSINGHEQIDVLEGQQVVLLKELNQVMVREVDLDASLSWKENMLKFHETPFNELAIKLCRYHNVEIEFMDDSLLDFKYSGTFIDESIEDIMQMLSIVTPISYKIYYRTSENDKIYQKPKIIIWNRNND